MKTFHSFYGRLPIIRELNAQASATRQLEAKQEQTRRELGESFNAVKACAIIQALETIKGSDPRYKDSRRLLVYGAQFWSQNYEDGMIAEIFRRIGETGRTFVEIGVGDGGENNTTALLSQGWRGWWIEGGPRNCETIRKRLRSMPSVANRLSLRESFVSPDQIVALFEQIGIPGEVDLFSLDIDQDTYHVWAALGSFKPRVVVIEYNSCIPPRQLWIHPYEAGRSWDGTQAFGASLKAFEMLGRNFGYSLVGCDIIGANAFFIRDDLVKDHFLEPFSAENHHEPPRYHLIHRWGHPSCLFGESNAGAL